MKRIFILALLIAGSINTSSSAIKEQSINERNEIYKKQKAAYLYLEQKKYEEAIKICEEQKQKYVKYWHGDYDLYVLVNAYFETNQKQKMIETIRYMAKNYPESEFLKDKFYKKYMPHPVRNTILFVLFAALIYILFVRKGKHSDEVQGALLSEDVPAETESSDIPVGVKLVEVCVTTNRFELLAVRTELEGNGIKMMVKGESVGDLYGVKDSELAEKKILVRETDAEKAKEIIEDLIKNEEETA